MARRIVAAVAAAGGVVLVALSTPTFAGELQKMDTCRPGIPGELSRDATGCPTAIDPYAKLVFDSEDHRAWYGRFWTGRCDGLSFWQSIRCQSGEPAWNELVDRTLARVPAARRPYLRFYLWRLGRLIGFEWARDNDIRKIDTKTLQTWFDWLDHDVDILHALTRISRAAHNALNRTN